MASVSDIHHKQRAVIEFLVAEKETVGNIHKRLCNCRVVMRRSVLMTTSARCNMSGVTAMGGLPAHCKSLSSAAPPFDAATCRAQRPT
ncbi:hypothetical protein C0J52_01022 [Blattella germanica]|nr:hypothetical protein C0J52_01022 [Blattella germanica]